MNVITILGENSNTLNSISQSPASQFLTPDTHISEHNDQQSLLELDSPLSIKSFKSSFQARRKQKLEQLDLSFNSPQLSSSGLNSEVSYLRRQLMGMVGKNLEHCPHTPNSIGGYMLSKYASKSNQTQDPKPFSRKFDQIFDIGRKIGEGGSSVVKECTLKINDNTNNSKHKYAVKIVKFSDPEQLFNIIEEQRIMSMLNHKNIVELVDFFIDKNKHCVHLVMENCQGKSLTQLIRKKHNFAEVTIKYIIRTLLKSVHYIHMKGICHRDLSNNNVIFDQTAKKIKLIDFSVSKECRNKMRKMWTKTGTLQFVAPESVQEEKDGYDPKVDIWSIGVIMFSLLTGNLPFQDPNDNELGVIDMIINQEPDYQKYIDSNQISLEAHALLTQLLEKDPLKRISIRQAIQNSWLQEKMERLTVITNYDDIVRIMKSPIFSTQKLKTSIDSQRQSYQNNKQKSLQIKKQPSFTVSNNSNIKNENGETEYAFSPRSKVISIGNPMCLQFHKQINQQPEAK